jgi:hypothetical protein
LSRLASRTTGLDEYPPRLASAHLNLKLSRLSWSKVDGAVALAMGVGVAQTEGARSIYEERPAFLFV